MVVKKTLVWDREAVFQLEEAYHYLKEKTPPSALKVKNAILSEVKKLPLHPEIYELDRFKLNNNGQYRAFEIYNYRIVYRVLDSEIRILRLRHSSREPKEY